MVREPSALLGVEATGISEEGVFGKDVDAKGLAFGRGVELGKTQGEGFLGSALEVEIEVEDGLLGMKAPEGSFGEDTDLGEVWGLGVGSGGSVDWDEQKNKEKKERKSQRSRRVSAYWRAVCGLGEQRRKRGAGVWDHQCGRPLFDFVKDFYCREGASWLS